MRALMHGHARHEAEGHALPDRSGRRASAREGAQSVVYLDPADNTSMWEAVKEDKVAGWAKTHPLDVLTGPAL